MYEKELLAIVYVITKWHHYLYERHFTIKIDHHSLKYLLQQRISFPGQHSWLTKLMGYDYDICYKKRKENVAADALSKIHCSELLAMAVSSAWGIFFKCLWILFNVIDDTMTQIL